MGATAAAAVVVVPTIAAAQPDRLREGVQALVNEIRQGLSGQVLMCQYWVLHEAADRLEALPGIEPVPGNFWTAEDQERSFRYGRVRALRGVAS